MKKIKLSKDQENWLCEVIGDWYLKWKNNITSPNTLHRLGYAKEDLKNMIITFNDEKGDRNSDE